MIFPKKILTIVLIVVLVGLCVYYFVVKKGSDSAEGEASSGEQAQETKYREMPLQVKVEKAKLGNLIIKLRSPGEAVTDRKIIIKASTHRDSACRSNSKSFNAASPS